MSAMAGCTGTSQARTATPQGLGSPRSLETTDDTRGIYVDVAQLLGFDHSLQVRRSENGVPHDLHDGDTAMTGDRIHVSIQTSKDAYLYLAFCAHQALTVYPQGGIRTRAGSLMFAPDNALILDSDPGPEVLYVILSRREISIADPKLADALAAKRPTSMPTDCGPSLESKLAKKLTPSTTSVLRGELLRKKPMAPPDAPNGQGRSNAAITTSTGPVSGSSGRKRPPMHTEEPSLRIANPPPDPDFERNPGNIVWYGRDGATGPADVVAADEDGIAVVRHTFMHVPLASPP